MAKKNLEKTRDILHNAHGELGEIIAQAGQIKNLDLEIETLLPENLRQHCKVANYNKGTLMLYVDSGALAAKCRYLKPQLISSLRSHAEFAGLASIDFKIAPEVFQKKSLEEKAVVNKTFSPSITQQLIELIASTEDDGIKKSLELLLKHKSQ